MKYFIYIISLLCSINAFSQKKINISKDVKSGIRDVQNTASLIEASNNIEKNAVAVYKSSEGIQLNEGFFADVGSDVFMEIEGSNYSQKDTASIYEADLLANEFSIYPNPTNGLFTIKSNKSIVSYTIYNVIGTQILFKEVASTNILNVDISNFSNGIYFVEVQKENGIFKEKIIKI